MSDWNINDDIDAIMAGEVDPEPPDEQEIDDALERAVFSHTGPVLEHIYAYSKGAMAGPWGVLAGCLARVVAEVPPWVKTPKFIGKAQSLNLFWALVDESGGGKTMAWDVSGDALDIGHPRRAKEYPVPTGEGLLDAFLRKPTTEEKKMGVTALQMKDSPHVLVYVDEIGQLKMSGERSGATVDPILRTLWSGGRAGTLTADPDRNRNLEPHHYRLSLVAGVQPDLADGLLSKTATASGTAQRWLWLPVIDPNMSDIAPEPDPIPWREPQGLADRMSGHPGITYPDFVRTEVRQNRMLVGSGRGTEEDKVRAHRMLTRIKVAAAVAVLQGTLEVDEGTWIIAGAILEKSDRTRARVLRALEAKAQARVDAKAKAAHRGRRTEAEEQNDHETRAAVRLWTCVAERCPKHEPGAGCTQGCFTRDLGRDRDLTEPALKYALGQDWLREVSDGSPYPRFQLGGSEPHREGRT